MARRTKKLENPSAFISHISNLFNFGDCDQMTHCGLYFREDDLIEVDHIIPTSVGGKNRYDNLQALHRHCHDIKTANDNLNSNRQNAVMEEDELALW